MKKIFKIAIVAFAIVAVGAATANAAFTRNLTVGSTGADVSELQSWLIAKGFSIPSIQSGAAQPGYFGEQTKNAVAAYQKTVGLPAYGFFGPLTIASLSGSTVVTVDPTACPSWANCTPKPGVNPTPSTGGREGQLINIDNATDTDSSVEEGEKDVYVVGAEVEAEDSTMTVERVDADFTLTDASTASDNLDDYITEVSVFVDGKKVATLDVDEADINDGDDGDDLTDDDNDVYSFRFTGLNAKVMDGQTADIYVAVTSVNNVDSDDEDGDWAVVIPEDGIRAVDESGITDTYVGSGDIDEESFSVGEADAGDLNVNFDSSDNTSETVSVDENSDTNGVEIFTFGLESDTSDNTVDSIKFTLATSTGVAGVKLSDVIRTIRLFADGEEVASEDVVDNASNAVGASVTFNDMDEVTIDEDEEVTFVVKVDLYETDGNYASGYAFAATLDRSEIDAEDANGDVVAVSGSDDAGGTKTLRTSGISVENPTFSPAPSVVDNLDTTLADDQGKYTINFTVKAFEDPAYIALSTTRGTTIGGGVNYTIEDATNSYAATTTGTVAGTDLERVSGGSVTGNYVKINAGQTATFKLTVYFNAALTHTYRAQLYSVNFAGSAIAADTQELVTPTEDYQTGSVQVQN